MIGVALHLWLWFFRQRGVWILGGLGLAARGVVLLTGSSEIAPERLQSRAILSLALLLLPFVIYLAVVPLAEEVRRATTWLGVSRRIGIPGLVVGVGLAVFGGLAGVLVAVFGLDLVLFGIGGAGEGRRGPRRALAEGILEAGETEASRTGGVNVRQDPSTIWLRASRQVAVFRFEEWAAPASGKGGDLAVHVRARARFTARGGEIARAVPLRVRFWSVDDGKRGEEAGSIELTVRGREEIFVPIPETLADASSRGLDLRCSFAVPGQEGAVGIEEARARLVGEEIPESVSYGKRLLRLGLVCGYLGWVALCFSAGGTVLLGVLMPVFLVGVGSVRTLLLEALGSYAFVENSSGGKVLWLQLRLLRGGAALSPDLARFWNGAVLGEAVDLPWAEFLGEASSLGLYCLFFFGIAWALCFLREVR